MTSLLTSSSLQIFFFALGCLGSRSGNDLTRAQAVSAILWIWDSISTGVNIRGEVEPPGWESSPWEFGGEGMLPSRSPLPSLSRLSLTTSLSPSLSTLCEGELEECGLGGCWGGGEEGGCCRTLDWTRSWDTELGTKEGGWTAPRTVWGLETLTNTEVGTDTPPSTEGATVTVGIVAPTLARMTAAAAAAVELWKPLIEGSRGDWNKPEKCRYLTLYKQFVQCQEEQDVRKWFIKLISG